MRTGTCIMPCMAPMPPLKKLDLQCGACVLLFRRPRRERSPSSKRPGGAKLFCRVEGFRSEVSGEASVLGRPGFKTPYASEVEV